MVCCDIKNKVAIPQLHYECNSWAVRHKMGGGVIGILSTIGPQFPEVLSCSLQNMYLTSFLSTVC